MLMSTNSATCHDKMFPLVLFLLKMIFFGLSATLSAQVCLRSFWIRGRERDGEAAEPEPIYLELEATF